MDQLERLTPVDLAPQPADMRFDDVAPGIEMELPDLLEQHGAGDDAARVAGQIFEQPELAWLQLDRPTTSGYGVPCQIDFEIGYSEHRLDVRQWWSARQRIDPCHQLGEGERLDQIVV